MITNCFQMSDDLQLIPSEFERAVNAIRQPDVKMWIDIQGFEKDELEEKLNKLDVTGFGRKLCIEAHDRPGFYPLGTQMLLAIPVMASAEESSEVQHVVLLVRKNLLLTLRDTRAVNLQQIFTVQDSVDWLPDHSIAGLLAAFMIVLSLKSQKRSSELRDIIMALEKRLDLEADSVDAKDISHKRSELLTLESVVSGQLPVIQALIANERASLKTEHVQEFLLCALANLQAADRTLHWLEGRIDVMRSLVDMQAQDKTNRRLARLTVLSTIFMPMTFLAGIWGMNFENMPGLRFRFGYQIAISSMLFIGAAMYWYFRKKGWFD